MSKLLRPNQIAKSGKESSIQAALFAKAAIARFYGWQEACLFDQGGELPKLPKGAPEALPELRWLHAVPNGATYGSSQQERARRGAQMKREGLRPGVADIYWPIARSGYHGLYIEMKTPTGSMREVQVEFRDFVIEQGYGWRLCRSYDEAFDMLRFYYDDQMK